MRLNMLLAGALAVAVVPLSAVAQPTTAKLPTGASGDACRAGWRWVPAEYDHHSEWAPGHCERISVPTGLRATISASETASAGTECSAGSRWLPAGYDRHNEWVPGH